MGVNPHAKNSTIHAQKARAEEKNSSRKRLLQTQAKLASLLNRFIDCRTSKSARFFVSMLLKFLSFGQIEKQQISALHFQSLFFAR
jgi:hypothetical protein